MKQRMRIGGLTEQANIERFEHFLAAKQQL